MEIRKVQITGGSSYIITLPKDWAKSLNIKKNDPLGLIIQPDGTLLVTSKITEERFQRMKEFDIGNINEPAYLFRCLIGAYIAGHTVIEIKSSERMPPFVRMVVRKFTQTTIGQEVVEETDKSITIRDLLDPAEMPFDSTIKRMHIIVKSMYEDVISALENRDKKLAEDVILRDNEVNRLHWLVARQRNMIIRNVKLSEKMSINVETAANYFLISRIIERIGDHAVRIAKNAINLVDKKVNKKIIDNIRSASDLALDIFNKSLESFFKGEIRKSNENIESVRNLESLCEEISNLVLQQRGVTAISVGYIVESIRRAGEYSQDISENVINYLVGQEKIPSRS